MIFKSYDPENRKLIFDGWKELIIFFDLSKEDYKKIRDSFHGITLSNGITITKYPTL